MNFRTESLDLPQNEQRRCLSCDMLVRSAGGAGPRGRGGTRAGRLTVNGSAADIEIQAKEILYLRAKMNELMSKHTGQPIERIERDTDRDRFMSAQEAKDYGMIDTIITSRGELVEASQLEALTK